MWVVAVASRRRHTRWNCDWSSDVCSSDLAVSHAHLERRIGRYRWVICALLFFATTISYIDRQVFGILAPEMKKIFGWTDTNYTDIVFWFERSEERRVGKECRCGWSQ